MNKFLILGISMPGCSTIYKGTYRTSPTFVEGLDGDSRSNKLFRWYVEEGGESGVVTTIEKALEMVREYKALEPSQHFQVVRLLDPTEGVILKEELLGFDISCRFYYSLLSWGLQVNDLSGHAGNKTLTPLLRLISLFFSQQLNGNGLFSSSETAVFCKECLLTLQDLFPGLWEVNGHGKFEVVGLSHVSG